MGRIVVFLAFLAVVLVVSDAQLTFSTGWGQGKRSGPGSVEPEPCSPEEGLYMLYKLIQKANTTTFASSVEVDR
ncbi:adipokinetic prohormone type 2-like [Ostrinia furnacalis]|uniref:adipokinetic prohormone type 2-like n=1 Tax=Ostrinia furnacalis TaxID=93504 RepID=UPI001038C095|nr:adipokinetic prohormone type 2-like [Ostrinia furnacalis]